MNTKIILASQSPRRKQLLQQIAILPICRPAGIDESVRENEEPIMYCRRLAIEKAQAVWDQSDQSIPVLGSDTIVVFNQEILGKPHDKLDAFNMLRKLSDQSHQVITAVAMINAEKHKIVDSISIVDFVKLSDTEINRYLKINEYRDKAGSYAIQGYAGKWVKNILGSYSGIMGLPLCETAQLIQEFT